MSFDLKNAIGLGVSGNFAGHLEQATKNIDFGSAGSEETNAPKGLFPIYVPSTTGRFLETYPISSSRLVMPNNTAKLKIEPEVALFCEVSYDGDRVVKLEPRYFTTYNDCSIHNLDVYKISEKKNWGPESKGLSESVVEIDNFRKGGIMDHYRLACYHKRDGELHAYGVDSPLSGYSYFHERLVTWIIDKMNMQTDQGPFEDIAKMLKQANFPEVALIGIGATRYSDYGERVYLEARDESIVVAYDARQHSVDDIEQLLSEGVDEGDGLSVLRQIVVL